MKDYDKKGTEITEQHLEIANKIGQHLDGLSIDVVGVVIGIAIAGGIEDREDIRPFIDGLVTRSAEAVWDITHDNVQHEKKKQVH